MDSSWTDSRETDAQEPRSLDPFHSRDVVPSAAYSRWTPSGPTFEINVPRRSSGGPVMELVPSFEAVDHSQLTSEELQVITQNSKQVALGRPTTWTYDNRYAAHAILDYLYLGPTSSIRDLESLTSQGITMMVVVRYSRMAGNIRSVDCASQELGIPVEYVRLGGFPDLIRELPTIIGLINRHMLSCNSQFMGHADQGQHMAMDRRPRCGKVLITCDSGNYHSATIAAAYLMSVFGQTAASATQFLTLQRLSCVFDEDAKQMLQTWEDVVRARSMTAHHVQSETQSQILLRGADAGAPIVDQPTASMSRRKRGFEDMRDQDMSGEGETGDADEDRFTNREAFAPFLDVSDILCGK
ncbi:hypothetical protein E4U09_001660 [Claviceps aff. purpurea]|uniref:Uncharacterized protein n=1 Tax=Claviceps aff. purpurea TaxID=1967640 RepID=A0A9P7QGX9_9HYPO|nr:hypothetical protein E4U09_001660 [Claviceps aff. purpurea]